MRTFPGDSRSVFPSPPPERASEAKRQQPDERSPLPQVRAVLAIERARVALGLGIGGVGLLAAGGATALAPPAHRRPLAREAKAMAEKPAAQHRRRGYAVTGDAGP